MDPRDGQPDPETHKLKNRSTNLWMGECPSFSLIVRQGYSDTYAHILCIEWAEELCIPRTLHLLIRAVNFVAPRLLGIDEIVRVVA
jgi:hypothetical protein